MTLAEEIKRIRDERGLTQKAFGKALDVSGPYITQLETAKIKSISYKFAAKICKVFDLPMDHFAPFLAPGVTIPPPPTNPQDSLQIIDLDESESLEFIGEVSAGVSGSTNAADPGERFTIRDIFPGADFLLRAKGRSMESAGIREGTVIGVQRNQEPDEGETVIARVDGGLVVKKVRYRKDQRIMLAPMDSENRGRSILLREGDEIIGVVVSSRAGPR